MISEHLIVLRDGQSAVCTSRGLEVACCDHSEAAIGSHRCGSRCSDQLQLLHAESSRHVCYVPYSRARIFLRLKRANEY